MRTTLARLTAAAIMATGLFTLATASPAQADTPGCVTKREWNNTWTGDSKGFTHSRFDTSGWLVDRYRSGINGRLLDIFRHYKSCGYPEDTLELNFDDYSFGSVTRGGILRVYAGEWTHYCINYEDFWSGDWEYNPDTDEWDIWNPHAYYDGSYCYDPGFMGDFYDDPTYTSAANRSAEKGKDGEAGKNVKVIADR